MEIGFGPRMSGREGRPGDRTAGWQPLVCVRDLGRVSISPQTARGTYHQVP
jgi:hypothetical protein